jgi:2-keto-3-deoxy-L-rhamnonate aldolase RhmA
VTTIANPVREALAAGKISLGVGVRGLRSGEIARMMKSAGFDWLFIDLEHGPSSVETAFSISVAALDAGIVPIVRVPEGEMVLAARCLDGGALGVFVSHVDTVEDAQAAVSALRFPPLGHRSAGGSYPQLGFRGGSAKEVLPALDHATMIMATLETAKAVENAAAIAAVPGIDVLTMGLNDLSVDMAIPGQLGHHRIAAAVNTVAQAARSAGKCAGFGGVYQPDLIKEYVSLGMRMILCGNDIGLLMAAAQERASFVRNCAP